MIPSRRQHHRLRVVQRPVRAPSRIAPVSHRRMRPSPDCSAFRRRSQCAPGRRFTKNSRQHRSKEDRQEERSEQRGNQRHGQRAEKDRRDAAQEHQRDEHHDGRQRGTDERRRQFGDRALGCLGRALAQGKVHHDVLHHHDGVVDHHPDAGGQPAQRHQVEAHVEQAHEHDRDQRGQGNHDAPPPAWSASS